MKTVLIMGHKICFSGKIRIIIPKTSPLPLLMWSTDITAFLKGSDFEGCSYTALISSSVFHRQREGIDLPICTLCRNCSYVHLHILHEKK